MHEPPLGEDRPAAPSSAPFGFPDRPLPTRPPAPGREPDPGSPSRRRLAFLLLLVLVPAVFLLQQSQHLLEAPASEVTEPTEAELASRPAPGSAEFGLQLRMLAPMLEFFPEREQSQFLNQLREQLHVLHATDDDSDRAVPSQAAAWADGLRLASVEAAGGEAEAAMNRIAEIRVEIDRAEGAALNASVRSANAEGGEDPSPEAEGGDPPSPEGDLARIARARADAALLEAALQDPGSLTPDDAAELETRLGYAGRVAAVATLPRTDPARRDVLAGGGMVLFGVIAFFVLLLTLVIAGLTCMVVAIVQLSRGRFVRRFVPPAIGGSVYSETLLLFVLGFLGLQLVAPLVMPGLVRTLGEEQATIIGIGSQWLLALIVFYPLLAGAGWSAWRAQTGLHRGRGVFREIGAGIFGYLAMLPLFGVAIVLTLLFVVIWMAISKQLGLPEGPPNNPILELLQNLGTPGLIVLGSLVVLWAPLVEEFIFRGAFYRHLRARMGIFLAMLISAVVFGVMHGYLFAMLLPVITLGFTFALLREWRGSLIAPITAHMLHNGAIFVIMVLVIKGLG
ncbi:MAG: CPBP family intramembrane metalloprotease [Phycisphaerales bacterium]|nr:MAG: CPBP family intramembrane metalloprotease [Phycisphaerales bacterium]